MLPELPNNVLEDRETFINEKDWNPWPQWAYTLELGPYIIMLVVETRSMRMGFFIAFIHKMDQKTSLTPSQEINDW